MPLLTTLSSGSIKSMGLIGVPTPPATPPVTGQQLFTSSTTGGTTVTSTGQKQYTFTVPADVTSISVLCVGAGGFSIGGSSNGGAGGALAYTNNYAVTPGQTFTVLVGTAGSTNQTSANSTSASSRNTTFGSTICGAGGGQTNAFAAPNTGGSVLNGTGGAGGAGATATSTFGGGGGGAGGYSGAGGAGGSNSAAGSSGSGGGAGGGGGSASNGTGGSGGGAGVYGAGTAGSGGASGGNCGIGGSGGQPTISFANTTPLANHYGAGAGSIRTSSASARASGGDGAVRIIWPGNTRQFPSTNVGNF